MTNLILQIIGFGALANLIVDMLVSLDTEGNLSDKPFKCEKCLAYWIAIVPFIWQFGVIGVLYAACSSAAASYIYKYTT
jgi:hypothetical protein